MQIRGLVAAALSLLLLSCGGGGGGGDSSEGTSDRVHVHVNNLTSARLLVGVELWYSDSGVRWGYLDFLPYAVSPGGEGDYVLELVGPDSHFDIQGVGYDCGTTDCVTEVLRRVWTARGDSINLTFRQATSP